MNAIISLFFFFNTKRITKVFTTYLFRSRLGEVFKKNLTIWYFKQLFSILIYA